MFCPKCGSQNADETKFCRGCGADLSNVLAAVGGARPVVGRSSESLALAEKAIELKSRGMIGLILSIGFAIISAIIYSIPPQTGIFWLFPLAFTFFFFATCVSRFVQARGIKELIKSDGHGQLPSSQTEYVQLPQSSYKTDGLAVPSSVTEHTTKHLKREVAVETRTLPKS